MAKPAGEDSIAKWERQLGLLSSLLKRREPMGRLEITRTVEGYGADLTEETARKRLQRDLDDLRALGVNIEFVKNPVDGEEGYVVDPDKTFLPNIEIGNMENVLLNLLAGSLHGGGGSGRSGRSGRSPMAENLRTALLKLQCSTGLAGSADADIEEKMLIHKRLGDATPPANLNHAFQAVSECRAASFDYRAAGHSAPDARSVDAYGLGFHGGAWYLVGRCHKRDEIRVFKLSRIAGPVSLGEEASFQIPAGFQVSEHVGVPAWRIGGESMQAKVWFDAEIAWMIADNVKGSDRFDLNEDGSGVLNTQVRQPISLVRWVFKFKQHARILEPQSLVQLAMKELDAMARLYAGGEGS